jgi:hypothetical protein
LGVSLLQQAFCVSAEIHFHANPLPNLVLNLDRSRVRSFVSKRNDDWDQEDGE